MFSVRVFTGITIFLLSLATFLFILLLVALASRAALLKAVRSPLAFTSKTAVQVGLHHLLVLAALHAGGKIVIPMELAYRNNADEYMIATYQDPKSMEITIEARKSKPPATK